MRGAFALAGLIGLASCAAPSAGDLLAACRVFGRVRDCAVVPLASAEADATAKTFARPEPGQARLYLVRPYFQAWEQTTYVAVDGAAVATLAPGTFTMLDLTPGPHTIRVFTVESREIALRLEPGSNYYLEDRVDRLFNTQREHLIPVTHEQAVPLLWRSRRVALESRK